MAYAAEGALEKSPALVPVTFTHQVADTARDKSVCKIILMAKKGSNMDGMYLVELFVLSNALIQTEAIKRVKIPPFQEKCRKSGTFPKVSSGYFTLQEATL